MKYFILIFAFLISLTTLAKNTCEAVWDKEENSPHWVGGNKNHFMALRSNSPHFWHWFTKNNKFKKELLVEGICMGDIHHNNIAPIKTEKGVDLNIKDFDDGRRNYLLGDFIQFAARVLAIPKKISDKANLKDLAFYYYSGLKGEALQPPSFIKKALKKIEENFAEKQVGYIDRKIDATKTKLNYEELGLTPIKKTNKKIQEKFKKDNKEIQKFLQDYEILDVGYSAKEEGGSRNMPRFWYLAKKEAELYIFEAKTNPESTHSELVEDVIKAYFNKGDRPYLSGAVDAPTATYYIHPKIYSPFDIKDLSKSEFLELSYLLANWTGLKHGTQVLDEKKIGQKLLKNIEKNDPEKVLADVRDTIREYYQVSQILYEQEPE